VGLGHEFLRHIERTRVLVHVIDLTRDDPVADRALIDAELAAFGHGLAEKPQLLALNKIDHPDGQAQLQLLTDDEEGRGSLPPAWGETPWVAVSALTRERTDALARRTLQLLREAIEAQERAAGPPVLRPEPKRRRFTLHRAADGVLVVEGRSPERWALTLDVENDEARGELFWRLRRLGVARAVQREGVRPGELLRIGECELRWEE